MACVPAGRVTSESLVRLVEESDMERRTVNSSKIRSVGYDERARVLEVEHSDGSIYQYSGVSAEVHRRMMSAPTIASFYQDRVEEDFSRKRVR
jgi:hypothetical protein